MKNIFFFRESVFEQSISDAFYYHGNRVGFARKFRWDMKFQELAFFRQNGTSKKFKKIILVSKRAGDSYTIFSKGNNFFP